MQTPDSALKPLPLPPLPNSILSIHGPQEHWLYSLESEPGTHGSPSPLLPQPSCPTLPAVLGSASLLPTVAADNHVGIGEPQEPGSHHHHCGAPGSGAGHSVLLSALHSLPMEWAPGSGTWDPYSSTRPSMAHPSPPPAQSVSLFPQPAAGGWISPSLSPSLSIFY